MTRFFSDPGRTVRPDALLAWGLASVLLAAAVLKILDSSATWSAPSPWIATGELLAAALLTVPATRRLASTAVAWGFLGAALTRSLMMALVPDLPACKCLGAVEADHGSLLIVQGVVIAVAGWVGTAPDSSEAVTEIN